MSMTAMKSFLETAQSDAALADQLVAIIAENPPEVIYPKVVTLAGAKGFEVTEADVKETHAEFKQAAESGQDGELGDDDLENVSGGVSAVTDPILHGFLRSGEVAKSLIDRGITDAANGVADAAKDVADFLKNW